MANLFPDIKLGDYQEIEVDTSVSAFEIFKRIYHQAKNVFLLESLGSEGKYNRYSYVGFDPLFTIAAKKGEIYIQGKSIKTENPFVYLSNKFIDIERKSSNKNGFCGGLVGYVSYEGTKYFENVFSGFDYNDFPDYEFGFYQDGLIFDKKGQRCVYFHYGKSRINEVRKFINVSGKLGAFNFRRKDKIDRKDIHRKMVGEAKKRIEKGDIFQVVLSLKSKYSFQGDNRKLYAVLRNINPSPYMIYMKFDNREIITASPELLIRVRGKTIEHFGTLAGTIKRGDSLKEDEILAQVLKSDEKEMAEHMMLVDLARNDLGKVCRFGSIKIPHLAIVKPFSFVSHLYSEIKGELNERENSFSALSACFPAGTLTGAPKIEAMKIISDLEKEERGPYGGVGGYFSLNGESMMAILIRSVFIKGENAYTQTGSGIVADSVADKEFLEVENKQKAFEKSLEVASL